VTDVRRVVDVSGDVVQAIDADVMEQASGPDEVGVEIEFSPGEKLFRYAAHDLAVRVDEIERLGRRRVLLVQRADLLVRRDQHLGTTVTSLPAGQGPTRIQANGTALVHSSS
jgi:hypothetical protein